MPQGEGDGHKCLHYVARASSQQRTATSSGFFAKVTWGMACLRGPVFRKHSAGSLWHICGPFNRYWAAPFWIASDSECKARRPLCKRKLSVTGWSAQMYSDFELGPRLQASTECAALRFPFSSRSRRTSSEFGIGDPRVRPLCHLMISPVDLAEF